MGAINLLEIDFTSLSTVEPLNLFHHITMESPKDLEQLKDLFITIYLTLSFINHFEFYFTLAP